MSWPKHSKVLQDIVLALALTCSCLAQQYHATPGTTSTTDIPITSSGTLIHDSGVTQSYFIAGSVSGDIVCDSDGHCYTRSSGSYLGEDRKDDGKGPTSEQLRQSAHLISATERPPAGYRSLAAEVGLIPSRTSDEAAVLDGIAQEGLRVYDYEKVDGYLWRKAAREGAHARWVWKPLRGRDENAITERAYSAANVLVAKVGYVINQQYQQEVPARVLAELKCMIADIPDALFLVSDYEVIKPDPFLAVTTPKLLQAGKIWIVDRWDEPGFTESGK